MDRTIRASIFPGTSGSERRNPLKAALLASTMLIAAPLVALAQELPTGGTVTSGNVSINTPGQGSMLIHQGSDRAVVNWNSFSIGRGGAVTIRQPGADSAILNRVTGDTTSRIHGSLTANGQVLVVNPNGIVIGENGAINTGGGFVASTLDISDQDFNRGDLSFRGDGSSAGVENRGTISVGSGGYAALIGGRIDNAGTISAPLGRIGLGAGERATLDLSGDRFLMVAVPSAPDGDDRALIRNSGRVSADGGRIEMKAATARNAARNAINLSGTAEARSVSLRNGAIVLGGGEGGTVRVSGKVSTRAPRQADAGLGSSARPPRPTGGQIDITGARIALQGALLDASGDGGGGQIRVGGGFAGQGPLPHAMTVSTDTDTRILADALTRGDGGRIALWSDLRSDIAGNLSARGGAQGGDGGFVEASSAGSVRYRGLADLRAPVGDWGDLLIDPTDISVPGTITEAVVEEALARGSLILDTSEREDSLPGNITLSADIDWTAPTTFTLLADNDITISGAINGRNGGLSLSAEGDIDVTGAVNVDTFRLQSGNWTQIGAALPAFSARDFRIDGFDARFLRALRGTGTAANPYVLTDVYGLQGMDSAYDDDSMLDSHFALANDINARGTSGWNENEDGSFAGFDPIGAAEGDFFRQFSGSLDGRGHSITGLFVGAARDTAGLFAATEGAEIRNLSLTGLRITAGSMAGGVVADAVATELDNVHTSGRVAVVSDFGSAVVGGVVGWMSGGTITDSSARTAVRVDNPGGEGSSTDAGGFAGIVSSGSTIARSFSTGNVTVVSTGVFGVDANVGGFVGDLGGLIRDAYSSGTVRFDQTGSDSLSGGASVGGFAGTHDVIEPGTMIRTAAHGAVIANGAGLEINVGGHTGANNGTILDSYADGAVTASSEATQNVGGLVGLTDGGTITNTYATGAVRTSGDAETRAGGLIGLNGDEDGTSTTVTASFYDPVRTGRAPNGLANYGQAVSTAIFHDTTAFLALAGAQGWDFARVWAPGDSGADPALYSIDRVVFARPVGLSLQYGTTGTAGTRGTVHGGPLAYVFAPEGDSLATAGVFDRLTFPDVNVGTGRFTLATTMLTSARGQTYRVVDLPAAYTITPAPLTITATDRRRTYGTGLDLSGGFITSGLVFDDNVDSVDLASLGTGIRTGVGRYAITAGNATGDGLANYDITYVDGALTVDPAALTITADDQSKPGGDVFTFDGTEFGSSGLMDWDSITRVALGSDGAPAGAGTGSYAITANDATGSGLENYTITYVAGTMNVTASPTPPPPDYIPGPEIIPETGLPNPVDRLPGELGPTDPGTAVLVDGANRLDSALATLEQVDRSSAILEIAAQSCAQSDADVSRYLACLSDALDDFANKLDQISTDLPPGLENVAQIVRDARRDIDRARTRAERRLASATTASEREAIRRDAIGEARGAIATASTRIRKAITLVRADDPELARVQTATINRVSAAVDSVGIELSRAVGL